MACNYTIRSLFQYTAAFVPCEVPLYTLHRCNGSEPWKYIVPLCLKKMINWKKKKEKELEEKAVLVLNSLTVCGQK